MVAHVFNKHRYLSIRKGQILLMFAFKYVRVMFVIISFTLRVYVGIALFVLQQQFFVYVF